MSPRSWIRRLFVRTPVCTAARSRRLSLLVEALEDRATPATFTVVSPFDQSFTARGAGSGTIGDLRYCIDQALQTNEVDTIRFAPSLAGKTINLTTSMNLLFGQSTPSNSSNGVYGRTAFFIGGDFGITIDGADAPGVTIDATPGFGDTATRIFTVLPGGKLTLTNLTVSGGMARGGNGGNPGGGGGAGMGGAVFADRYSSFSAENVTFSNNRAIGGNGGAGMSTNGGGGGGGGMSAAGQPANGDNGGDGGGATGSKGALSGKDVVANTNYRIVFLPGGSVTLKDIGGGGGGGGRSVRVESGNTGSTGTGGNSLFNPITHSDSWLAGPNGDHWEGGGGGSGLFGGGGGGGGSGIHGAGFGGFGGGGGGGNVVNFPGGAGFGGGNGQQGPTDRTSGGGGGGGAGMGGAIFSNAATLRLTHVVFQNNSAQGGGGGPAPQGSPGNFGFDGRGLGGSVFVLDGSVMAFDVTSSGGAAYQGPDFYLAPEHHVTAALGQLNSDQGNNGIGGGTNATVHNITLPGNVDRTDLAASQITLLSPTRTFTNAPVPASISIAPAGGVGGASLEGVTPAVRYFRVNSDGTTTDLGTTAPTAVGSYRIQVSFPGTPHYGPARLDAPFAVVQATPAFQMIARGGVYTGASYQVTARIFGVGGARGDELEGVPMTLKYVRLNGDGSTTDLGASAPSSGGNYRVTAAFAGSTSYVAAQRTVPFTIAGATPAVTVSAADGFFDGRGVPVSGTVAGLDGRPSTTLEGVGLTFTYVRHNADGSTSNFATSPPFNVGTYTVTATFPGSTDYASDSASATYSIKPAATSLYVTTAVDEDDGTSDPSYGTGTSLREAVGYLNRLGSGNVSFAPYLSGQTIRLTRGEMILNPGGGSGIVGPGADKLTIQGDGTSRIFTTGNSVTIRDVTISGGSAGPTGYGGAILNTNSLILTNVVLTGNSAGYGGAIASQGAYLYFNGVRLTGNVAGVAGGAVYNAPGSYLSVTESTLTNNRVTGASGYGGGLANLGSAILFNSRVAANQSTGAGGFGGGVASVAPASTQLVSSLVANNSAATSPDVSGAVTGYGNTVSNASGSAGWDANNSLNVGSLSLVGLTPRIRVFPQSKFADGTPLVVTNGDIRDPYSAANIAQFGDSNVSVRYYTGSLSADQATAATPLPGAPSAVGHYTVVVSYTTNTADYVSTSAAAPFSILAPLVVNSLGDDLDVNATDGHLSLRTAVELANQVYNFATQIQVPITFAPELAGQTIHLGSPLTLRAGVSIVGPGADKLTVTADYRSGLFDVRNGVARASIAGLTLTGAAVDSAVRVELGSGLDLRDCFLTANGTQGVTPDYAGALYVENGTVYITGCTFAGNASRTAGAIYVAGSGTITNSTIADNAAGWAGSGQVYMLRGALQVINSTVTGGTAGGVISPFIGTSLTIGNSIVAGNGTDVDVDDSNPVISLGHNLIGKADDTSGWVTSDLLGTSADPLDPLLGTLGNHGGPLPTMVPLPGSPAINAGDVALALDAAGHPLPFDQRGLYRVWNGQIDIGAVESPAQPLLPTVSVVAPSVVYDGAAHGATNAGVFGVGGQSLSTFGDASLGYAYYAGTLTVSQLAGATPLAGAPQQAGAYTVVASFTSPYVLYASAASAPAYFTIAPQAITINADAQTKVAGSDDPLLTYQVTVGSLVGGDQLGGSLARDTGEAVGSYAIRQGTLTGGANYAVTLVGSSLFITGVPTSILDSQTAAVSTAGGPVTATSGAPGGDPVTTATASGFDGAVTVTRYDSAPTAGFTTAGTYFDVNVRANSFTSASSVQVHLDNLTPGTQVYWSPDNVTWAPLTDANGTPLHADASGSLTFIATTTSYPSLSDLTGTYLLAGTVAPAFNVPARQSATYGDSHVTVAGTLSVGTMVPVGATLTATLGSQTVPATVGPDGAFAARFDISALSAGTHVIQYAFSGSPGFTGSSAQSTLVIAGALPTISVSAADVAFDGNAHGVTATVAGRDGAASDRLEGVGLMLTYRSGNLVFDQAPTLGGTYTVVASFAGSADYAPAESAPFTFTIIPRAITVTADAGQGKVYGNADPVFTYRVTSGSLVEGDGFISYLTRDAGENVGDYAIGRHFLTAGPSYIITFVGATFHVRPRPITGGFTAADKVYDSDLGATVTGRTLSGAIEGDTVHLTGGTAAFADKNVGTGKMVMLTGATLFGTDAVNYSLTGVDTTTANISQRALTVSATGVNKAFDGTTAATVTLSDDRLAGDQLTPAYTSANFADPNLGTGKPVTVTGISVTGPDANNYRFNTTSAATANIISALVSVGLSTDRPVAVPGLAVTFTATVTAASGVPVIGTVTFRDGTTVLGTVPVVNGVARFTTDGLQIGARTITATFIGGTNFTVQTAPPTVHVSVVPAAVLGDPVSGQKALFVGGTAGNDEIKTKQAGDGRLTVEIKTGSGPKTSYNFTGLVGRIVVYAGAGDDIVDVDGNVTAPVWQFGGDGNDILRGGEHALNLLVGGAGSDILKAGNGRDILIGGAGADRLEAKGGDDLLIGGATSFDAIESALWGIQQEWTSTRDFATRVTNLRGTGTGPRANGSAFLVAGEPGATLCDDDSGDTLKGDGGRDWIFANLVGGVLDTVFGLKAEDLLTEL